MRKLLWSCTAAGVLTAGVFLTASHVLQKADLEAGDSILSSATLGSVQGGMVLAEKLLGTLRYVRNVHNLRVAAEAGKKDCPVAVPADPVAVPREDKIPELPMAGVMELPSMPENAAPATVVIHEEQEPAAGLAGAANAPVMPGSGSTIEAPACPGDKQVLEMPRVSRCGTGQDAPEAPLHMPTCAESEEAKIMPPADEEEPAFEQTSDDPYTDAKRRASGSSEDAETSDPQSEETPQNESPYHHYPESCPSNYCPYTGRCYPSTPYTEPQTTPEKNVTEKDAPEKKAGKEETSEPAAPAPKPGKQSGLLPSPGIGPFESNIDTMEYRRSDGGLNETEGGPY